jgi:8-oxo-dGTP pyrophosphatase MutT (NUDIX family)
MEQRKPNPSLTEHLNNIPEKKEIHRTAVIDEMWVVTERRTPQVYVSLLHKKSNKPQKQWWETVGGGIDGKITEKNIHTTGRKELQEEAWTNISPEFIQSVRLTTDPHESMLFNINFPLEKGSKKISRNEYLNGINSYPMIIRRVYRELPQVLLGNETDIPERQEHDDYRLLDMTGAYFSRAYSGFIMRYMKDTLLDYAKNKATQQKDVLPFLTFIRDPKNSKIITLENPENVYRPIFENFHLSDVAVANLYL